jgi:hypothetical protein
MEILAIVILGVSTILGFATNERKPRPKLDIRKDEDPDRAFTESYDMGGSNAKND